MQMHLLIAIICQHHLLTFQKRLSAYTLEYIERQSGMRDVYYNQSLLNYV